MINALPADLQLFEGRRTRFASAPTLGIQRRGNFSLNAAGYELLGEPEALLFYFSPSANVIAAQSVAKDTPKSYPVRKQQNARSWLVGARSFLTQNKIPFEAQDDAAGFTLSFVEGMGVIELSEHPQMVPDDSAGK